MSSCNGNCSSCSSSDCGDRKKESLLAALNPKSSVKKVIAVVSGKGGVGKTSVSATIVKLLVEAYPDKKILAIDADPAVGLSTALGIDVGITIDDIRKEIVSVVEDGNTRAAIEVLGDARYKIFDALVETDGFAFIAVGRPESAGCYCKRNTRQGCGFVGK